MSKLAFVQETDFYAPRAKYSLSQKLIRSFALLSMLGVGVVALSEYWGAFIANLPLLKLTGIQALIAEHHKWYGGCIMPPDTGPMIMATGITQTVLLCILWRCLHLQRWACALTGGLSWLAGLLCIAALFEEASLVKVTLMVAFCLAVPAFTAIIIKDWQNLKSGW